MPTEPTVTIEPVEGHNALRLGWCQWIAEHDIRPAFHKLTAALDRATAPVHIIVDLQNDPRLPLQSTIYETLAGPFMHRMMGEWLVIGTNRRAQIVANVITAVGLRTNIHWFNTEAEAYIYLEKLEARTISTYETADASDADGKDLKPEPSTHKIAF